jgi:hypothetical protein
MITGMAEQPANDFVASLGAGLLISDIDRHRSGRGHSPTGSRRARADNATGGVAGAVVTKAVAAASYT